MGGCGMEVQIQVGALDKIRSNGVMWVDLQFTDLLGGFQHISVPREEVDEKSFSAGVGKLDGSSIKGFKAIYESDMLLLPDSQTYAEIPWEQKTARLICDVNEVNGERFERDPRHIAQTVERELAKQGFVSYWGPELEFFVFDSVKYDTSFMQRHQSVTIDSQEAAWNSTGQNHPIGFKEGYYPVPPADTLQEFRRQTCELLQNYFGTVIEAHHHEVATAGQCEIDMRYDALVRMADKVQTYKMTVKNVAKQCGKIATFMPKPIYGDNGSGMHVHQSLWKGGENAFFDENDKYAGLSQTARYYLGGLMHHARALSAIVAPTINSYRRLVPGFEAPVNIAYSKRNRSAAIRIPTYFGHAAAKRLEYRPPDPSCNPYLAFAAMALAGLDGIKHKMDCGEPVDENIWHLTTERKREKGIRQLPGSLEEALNELESDHGFLKPAFAPSLIEVYLELKREENNQAKLRPTPYEFQLYLNV